MKMKTRTRILSLGLFLLAKLTSIAHDQTDAEALVHRYFEVFQRQDWDSLLSLLHPELISQSKSSIVALLSNDKMSDDTRSMVLEGYGVKTIEELQLLDPKVFYLRTLARGSATKEMQLMKSEVKSVVEIDEVAIYEDGYVVLASVKSTMRGKEFVGTTEFSIIEYEGRLLVRSMLKTKKKPGEE